MTEVKFSVSKVAPVVTFRTTELTDKDVQKMKKHNWFYAEFNNTISFQPDEPITEYMAKKTLTKFFKDKGVQLPGKRKRRNKKDKLTEKSKVDPSRLLR